MRTQMIVILIALVVLVFGQQGKAFNHEPFKSRKLCDTIYSRGEYLVTREYYLIIELICDACIISILYDSECELNHRV